MLIICANAPIYSMYMSLSAAGNNHNLCRQELVLREEAFVIHSSVLGAKGNVFLDDRNVFVSQRLQRF